eukprot:scaffold248518_cov28-Tisochrysis_lutea.AAC.1
MEVALPGLVLCDPALFQEVNLHLASSQARFSTEVEFEQLAETRGIVIAQGACLCKETWNVSSSIVSCARREYISDSAKEVAVLPAQPMRYTPFNPIPKGQSANRRAVPCTPNPPHIRFNWPPTHAGCTHVAKGFQNRR